MPVGSPRILSVKREIILSAGAVKTPQIRTYRTESASQDCGADHIVVMLSGIGDAAHLSSHSIRPIVDLPDVGRNLQVRPYFISISIVIVPIHARRIIL